MKANTDIVLITGAEKARIWLAVLASGCPLAAEQAALFIDACERQDEDWPQYAANPDLVAALGHNTADAFLGWP